MRHGVGLECASAAKAERALKIGSSCLSPEFAFFLQIYANLIMQHHPKEQSDANSHHVNCRILPQQNCPTFPPEVADTGEAAVPK